MYMYTYQKWNVIVDGMNFIKNEFLQYSTEYYAEIKECSQNWVSEVNIFSTNVLSTRPYGRHDDKGFKD